MTIYSLYEFDSYESDSAEIKYIHSDVCKNRRGEHGANDDCPCLAVVVLPHQCDQWCIGVREDVEALIAELRSLLPMMPAGQQKDWVLLPAGVPISVPKEPPSADVRVVDGVLYLGDEEVGRFPNEGTEECQKKYA